MSDLIKRLNKLSKAFAGGEYSEDETIFAEAADLIERQQREIEELSKPIDLEVAGDFLISSLIDSDAENCREHHYGHENGNKYYIRVGEIGSEQPIEKLERLEQERDALAAHVERLKNEINTTVLDAIHQYDDENNGYWIITLEQLEALEEVDDQSPQTSLAEVRAREVLSFTQQTINRLAELMPESKANKWDYYKAAVKDFAKSADEHANKIRNGKDGE